MQDTKKMRKNLRATKQSELLRQREAQLNALLNAQIKPNASILKNSLKREEESSFEKSEVDPQIDLDELIKEKKEVRFEITEEAAAAMLEDKVTDQASV